MFAKRKEKCVLITTAPRSLMHSLLTFSVRLVRQLCLDQRVCVCTIASSFCVYLSITSYQYMYMVCARVCVYVSLVIGGKLFGQHLVIVPCGQAQGTAGRGGNTRTNSSFSVHASMLICVFHVSPAHTDPSRVNTQRTRPTPPHTCCHQLHLDTVGQWSYAQEDFA